MPVNKTCVVCGAPFVDRSDNQVRRYCSRECKWAVANLKARKTAPQINKTCGICSQDFVDQSRANIRRYCSEKCAREAEYRKARKGETTVNKTCNFCGVEFEDRAIRHLRKYCSGQCKQKAINLSRLKFVQTKKTCEVCSVTYVDRCWDQQRSRFCSKKCKQHASYMRHREQRIADVTTQYHRRRGAFVSPVVREVIYARDNNTCQLCGKRVKMTKAYPDPLSPSIDHILPLSKGGTHEPRNVQLAHLRCNLRKHNTGVDQLRLFGE